jgi:hypothetical protein
MHIFMKVGGEEREREGATFNLPKLIEIPILFYPLVYSAAVSALQRAIH